MCSNLQSSKLHSALKYPTVNITSRSIVPPTHLVFQAYISLNVPYRYDDNPIFCYSSPHCRFADKNSENGLLVWRAILHFFPVQLEENHHSLYYALVSLERRLKNPKAWFHGVSKNTMQPPFTLKNVENAIEKCKILWQQYCAMLSKRVMFISWYPQVKNHRCNSRASYRIRQMLRKDNDSMPIC